MIPSDLRGRLVDWARRKDRRVLGHFSGLPCDWRPGNVINPESGMPFVDASAWEYIAQLLESGHEAEMQTLDVPSGAQAVVLMAELGPGQALLYIKVQVGAGRVIGRSFHPSYVQRPARKP